MKLIDKDALIVEIKRLHQTHSGKYECDEAALVLEDIEDFIDTLEVKEVDLEKEIDLVEDKYRGFESLSRADIIAVAKHFFEFGLKVQKGE